jgi:hypothetical protein
MTVHSGKFAALDGIDTVAQWTINHQQAPARGVASNTALGPVRKKGVSSWTGNYNAYGGIPVAMPGELIGFIGYTAPTNDISGAGMRYSGNVMIDSVAITWNWRTGDMLKHTVNFSGDLALARASGAQITDVAVPDMPSIAVCAKPTWKPAASGAHAALPGVGQITLTFTAANQSYVNSDTVIGGSVWTGRKSGPIDWTATVVQDDIEMVAPLPGEDVELKFFVDATLFWLLKWGHTRDDGGITANIETGAILSRTINFDMTGHDGTALGVIQKPGATDWWPFA